MILGLAEAACGRSVPPEPEVKSLVARLAGPGMKGVNDAARMLVAIGAPAIESLKLPVTAPYRQRAAAIEVLGWMGAAAEPAVPWLMESFRTDAEVRSTTSRTLGRIGRAAVPPLIALLGSSADAELRALACEALGMTRLQDEGVRRALLECLRGDPHRAVRDRAASALGDISFRDDETLRALESVADTNALNAQFYATYALAHMGPEGTEVLLRLVRSSHEGARASAVGSLGSAKGSPVEPRIDALLVALRDPSTWVRGNAAGALCEIGPAAVRTLPELRQAAVALAAEGDEVAASKARDAVERLEARTESPPAQDSADDALPGK